MWDWLRKWLGMGGGYPDKPGADRTTPGGDSDKPKITGWTVGLPLVISFAVLIFLVFSTPLLFQTGSDDPSAASILIVFSVIALLLSLAFTAFVFFHLKLSSDKNPLGLPEGSVRAVIALALIVIFMVSSLLLYSEVRNPPVNRVVLTQEQADFVPVTDIAYKYVIEPVNNTTRYAVGIRGERSQASEDMAKQILTTVSTLVVAVAGFYFGSKTVSEANDTKGKGGESAAPATPVSAPLIREVDPKTVEKSKRGTDISFRLTGKNLELAQTVKLVLGPIEHGCTGVKSSSTEITCTLNVPDDPAYPGGTAWTVVVINADTGEDRLPNAVTLE